MNVFVEAKDMIAFTNTFLFHWVDSEGNIVHWDDFNIAQECVKWHAFCTRCGDAKNVCTHNDCTFGYCVGSGEATNHVIAMHLLNIMSLNHISCERTYSSYIPDLELKEV